MRWTNFAASVNRVPRHRRAHRMLAHFMLCLPLVAALFWLAPRVAQADSITIPGGDMPPIDNANFTDGYINNYLATTGSLILDTANATGVWAG